MEYLQNLAKIYLRQKATNFGLTAFCLAFLGVQSIHFFVPIPLFFQVFSLILAVLAAIFFVWKKFFSIPEQTVKQLAQHLDSRFPSLEYSTVLLLENDPDSPFLALQKEKILPILQTLPQPLWENPIRKYLKINALFLSLGIVLSFFSWKNVESFLAKNEKKEFWEKALHPNSETPEVAKPQIETFELFLEAPPYSQIPVSKTQEPNLQILENTKVRFEINAKNTEKITFFFQTGDSLLAKRNKENTFVLEKRFLLTDLYKIKLENGKNYQESNYFVIEVRKDIPPQITIIEPTERQEIRYGNPKKTTLKIQINDDFGLNSAQIIATVTSGKGEAVKFREMILPFSRFSKGSKNQTLLEGIDLEKLGMNWGDELYFYVKAQDNKQPFANENRSELLFVVLQDTSEQVQADMEGIAIDLVPDYFRSQRQIIIDANKLLKIKSTISLQTFKQRSNELGFDQKALRLRYSQFVGEEFESNMVKPQEEHEHGEGEKPEEEHYEGDGHDHGGHQHEENNDPNKTPDPLSGYVHAHDSEQEATFHAPKIKATLKAALAEMWQAELHFRLYDPKSALPYCEKALEILKILQQKDRVYVRKVGYESPPLKVLEKRLTGDLEKVHNFDTKSQFENQTRLEASRKAIPILVKILQSEKLLKLNASEKTVLEQAGKELAGAILGVVREDTDNGRQEKISAKAIKMTNQKHLQSLGILREVIDNKAVSPEKMNQLIQTFWAVLPSPDRQPRSESLRKNRLQEIFWEKM